jgi:EmrB/QacA subfamily drug resistance transporter
LEHKKRIPYKWLALITVAIGTYMGTLDASIVNMSLPRLTRVFNTDASTVLWVSIIYLLISVSLMFTFSRVGDALGRKKMYTIGFCLFTVGLTFCALSQNIGQLIGARAIQAVGSAMVVSLGSAIVTAAFPDSERGKALGIIGAVVSAGLLSGPVLGGVLVDLLDWPSIFYVRIPVSIGGLAMAIWLLKEQKTEGAGFRFDWAGALTLSGTLACLLLFFNTGGRMGFGSLPVLLLAAGFVVLLVLFLVSETHAPQPILDLNLFRNRLFAAGSASLVLMFVAITANTFLMPFYLIEGLEFPASQAGLLFAVVSMTALVIGPLSGWLSDRIGYRLLTTAGMALMTSGLFWLSRLTAEASIGDIIPRLMMMGTGSGLFSSPNNSAIMGSVPADKLSTGSAMLATTRQVGISSGTAIAGALFTSRQAAHLVIPSGTDPAVKRLALVAGYQDALLIAAIVCAVAIFTSMLRGTTIPRGVNQTR